MTRQRKITITVSIGAILSGLTVLGAWVTPRAATFVDERYVHQVAYTLDRRTDSLNYRNDLHDILGKVSHIDSTLDAMKKHR